MSKTKARGNGQGTAYRRGNVWEAQVVIGWKEPSTEGGHPIPVKRRKSGFATKREALAYCTQLLDDHKQNPHLTLQQVYLLWVKAYVSRVGESTMAGYKAAFAHFLPVHYKKIEAITAQDLQDCMDNCPAGKRTRQMMKVTAGLIWAYAFDNDLVTKDATQNLYTGKGQSVQREPLTDAEVETIKAAIGTEQYADYIYALCYLGFRPGEFLALKKSDYHVEGKVAFLVGGSKTEAGKNRRVPIPEAIAPIIEARRNTIGTDLLFPQYTSNRKGEFTGFKQMTHAYFREHVFKPLMAKLGIADGKVPYSARHTYSDKLKSADGDDKTKAAIMGHTDYDFTKKRYQSTTVSDIQTVAKTIK